MTETHTGQRRSRRARCSPNQPGVRSSDLAPCVPSLQRLYGGRRSASSPSTTSAARRSEDQGGQRRDQMDAAVLPDLRR
jgi:hypothetical protein